MFDVSQITGTGCCFGLNGGELQIWSQSVNLWYMDIQNCFQPIIHLFWYYISCYHLKCKIHNKIWFLRGRFVNMKIPGQILHPENISAANWHKSHFIFSFQWLIIFLQRIKKPFICNERGSFIIFSLKNTYFSIWGLFYATIFSC